MNFQEIIDENLAYINGSNDSVKNSSMFGSTIAFRGGSINNLIMCYAKDVTKDGDALTVVTILEDQLDLKYVYLMLNEILVSFKASEASSISPGLSLNQISALDAGLDQQNTRLMGNTSFKLRMTDIIENSGAEVIAHYGSINDANHEIEQVRTLMNDNIERVLQRGERINLLVNKTDKLNNASGSFRRRTVAIKRKLWWGNFKFITILVFCGIFILYLIGGEFCGLPIYSKCFTHGDGE